MNLILNLEHRCAGRLRKPVLANDINKFGFGKNIKVFLSSNFALLKINEPLSSFDGAYVRPQLKTSTLA